MKLSHHLAIAIALACAAALVALAITHLAQPAWLRQLSAPELAADVPYVRLDGSVARIGALRGHVVLINFWATTCSTCIQEMPLLVATHQQFKARGFDTLAVAMQDDPPVQVLRFAQSRQLPFTVVIDNQGEMARRLGPVAATPTTLLVNKRGEIVNRLVGHLPAQALHAAIERLLAEP